MLTVRELLRDLDVRVLAGEANLDAPGALGPHLRARRPDAVAVGRRAAADDRAWRSTPPSAQRDVRRAGWPTTGSPGLGLRHRLRATTRSPTALVEAARRARLPALRGALRHAVHRGHREGVHAAGQRAVRACCSARSPRRSACSASSSPSAGSTRSSRRSPTLIGGAALVFDGRGEPQAQRTFRRELDAEARRRARRRAARARPPRRRRAASCPATPSSRRARSRCRSRRRRRARRRRCRRRGWSRSRTPAACPSSTA